MKNVQEDTDQEDSETFIAFFLQKECNATINLIRVMSSAFVIIFPRNLQYTLFVNKNPKE